MDLMTKYLYKYEPVKLKYKYNGRIFKAANEYTGRHGGWYNRFYYDRAGNRLCVSSFKRNGIRYLYSMHLV